MGEWRIETSAAASVSFFAGWLVVNIPPARLPLLLQVAIDRFQRDKSDPSVIVFSEINVVKILIPLNFFKKQKFGTRSSGSLPFEKREH